MLFKFTIYYSVKWNLYGNVEKEKKKKVNAIILKCRP